MISTLKRIQAKKAAQENNGGFTLIELLIVIVVLGILAAVVVFSLGGVTGTSAVAACQADGATVNTAIAAYTASNGTAPLAQSLLTAGSSANLQSWPSNSTHYQMKLSTTGQLLVAEPGAAPTATAPTPGTLVAGDWNVWTGAATCQLNKTVK